MATHTAAEQALKDGDLQAAIQLLQAQVRSQPADPKLRVFLFQLLCVQGDWPRALNQLGVAGGLDAAALPMVQAYRETIHCELLRAQVFLGQKAPLLFGEPEGWIALLIEALLRDGRGDHADADRLRAQAFEQAPATPGQAQGAGEGPPSVFEWIADADMRIGPVLEAVVNGRYYWVPFSRLAAVAIESPADLRDRVWMPASLTFVQRRRDGGLPAHALRGQRPDRPADCTGAQDRVVGAAAGPVRRQRPAHARHRCRRPGPHGPAVDHARPGAD
jgi:type VI secretion system protein ImpE